MKILFNNGLIVDGTRQKPYLGSVLVVNDTIQAVGQVDVSDADETIDLQGLVIAPGFIDTHSHSDLQILTKPQVYTKYFS